MFCIDRLKKRAILDDVMIEGASDDPLTMTTLNNGDDKMTKFEKGFTYYSTEFGGFSFELGDEISDGKYMINVEWFHIPCSGDGIIYLTNDNTIGFVMVNNGCRAYGAPSFTGDAFVKVTPTYFIPSHILKK